MSKQGELFPLVTHNDPPRRGTTIARYRLVLVREDEEPYGNPTRCAKPAAVARFLHQLLEGYDREVFGALFLDGRNRAVGHTLAYVGGLSRTVIEPRGVFTPALLANANAVILFHNHPSGDPTPSKDDRRVTRRLAEAGDLLRVKVLDHVIVGEPPGYCSLRTEGGW